MDSNYMARHDSTATSVELPPYCGLEMCVLSLCFSLTVTLAVRCIKKCVYYKTCKTKSMSVEIVFFKLGY